VGDWRDIDCLLDHKEKERIAGLLPSVPSAAGEPPRAEIAGAIEAVRLRQAHALIESSRTIGKLVLGRWPSVRPTGACAERA
jgi:hypothetical protein